MQKHWKTTFTSWAVCLLVGAALVAGPRARAAGPAITFTKATAADQKAINAQKVCKVSGKGLGSMGSPIKASRGDRAIFLCCASCEKQVLADPDKYFGKPGPAPAPK